MASMWVRCECHPEGRHLFIGRPVASRLVRLAGSDAQRLAQLESDNRLTAEDWSLLNAAAMNLPRGSEDRAAFLREIRERYHRTDLAKQNFAPVIARSGGYCERDHPRPVRATVVHHLHYQTLFRERPEDLLHICRPCHEYLHPEHSHRLIDPVDADDAQLEMLAFWEKGQAS